MFGIIFITFFFVLGSFEFIGKDNIQVGLSLYFISAVFYIGSSIWTSAKLKCNENITIVKTIVETVEVLKKANKKKDNTNNQEGGLK